MAIGECWFRVKDSRLLSLCFVVNIFFAFVQSFFCVLCTIDVALSFCVGCFDFRFEKKKSMSVYDGVRDRVGAIVAFFY